MTFGTSNFLVFLVSYYGVSFLYRQNTYSANLIKEQLGIHGIDNTKVCVNHELGRELSYIYPIGSDY
jgi:hypothetical protein